MQNNQHLHELHESYVRNVFIDALRWYISCRFSDQMDRLEPEESRGTQFSFCPGLDPYRDDPPASKEGNTELSDRRDISGSDALSHEVSSVTASRPVSVCSCGKCVTNIVEEDRKCCQDVPGWQEQYNFAGLLEMILSIMFIHYSKAIG